MKTHKEIPDNIVLYNKMTSVLDFVSMPVSAVSTRDLVPLINGKIPLHGTVIKSFSHKQGNKSYVYGKIEVRKGN